VGENMTKFLHKILLLSLCSLIVIVTIEVSYFLYKTLYKKEKIVANLNELDFSRAKLFIPDKEVGFILKPDSSTSNLPNWKILKETYDKEYHGLGKLISTNSAGYRGKLYFMTKQKDAIRILVLGDSVTWGCFSDDGCAWPDYLEKFLQERINKKIEVMNCAVGGYTSLQNLLMYERVWKHYNPDIILIACWYNDIYYRSVSNASLNESMDFDVYKALAQYNSYRIWCLYPFRGGRVFFNEIKSMINKYKNIHHYGGYSERFYKSFYTDKKLWVKNYLDIISHFKAKKVYVIALPAFFNYSETLPDYDILMYHRPYIANNKELKLLFQVYKYHSKFFQDLLIKKGYKVIPCEDAFKDYSFLERAKYYCDEMHLSNDGNEIFGNYIGKKLIETDFNLKEKI